MTANNLLCDSIIRIKNGYKSHKQKITIKNSKTSLELLKILRNEGYIRGFLIDKNFIEVSLKYFKDKPVIKDIKSYSPLNSKTTVSFKGLKQICNNKNLKSNGLTLNILSTSLGILSDYQCINHKIGGKLLLMIS
jgi:small subunit ribosomal protein S8